MTQTKVVDGWVTSCDACSTIKKIFPHRTFSVDKNKIQCNWRKITITDKLEDCSSTIVIHSCPSCKNDNTKLLKLIGDKLNQIAVAREI